MSCETRPLPPITSDVLERFWGKVLKLGSSGCWLWAGTATGKGYGMLAIGGSMWIATRISWKIRHGSDPFPLDVCHNCPGEDNPRCVNPDHLWLGTHKENLEDWSRKYQASKPPEPEYPQPPKVLPPVVPVTRMTPETARRVREFYKARRVTLHDLAACLGVGKSTISRAINGYYDGIVVPGEGRHILSEEEKLAARAEFAAGAKIIHLAKKYGVGEGTMHRYLKS